MSKVDMRTPQTIKNAIQETESGVYGSMNNKGEIAFVLIEKSVRMEVQTFQFDGTVKFEKYCNEGNKTLEEIKGRWTKKDFTK